MVHEALESVVQLSSDSKGTTRHVRLKHLTTLAEVRASNETIHVYVVAIPQKSASAALKTLKDAKLDRSNVDLQHLRRFVKPAYLPHRLREELCSDGSNDDVAYLYMCPTSQIQLPELSLLLRTHCDSPFYEATEDPAILTIPVPSHAPTSAVQAADWSLRYWPISYKNTNPYGPHPALVRRAEAELIGPQGDGVTKKLHLAEQVAREARETGIGERAGCVIVARNQLGFAKEEIVAVSGDARWSSGNHRSGPGNVMAHAVLRAIGMVARKRLKLEGVQSLASESDGLVGATEAFAEEPLTRLEAHYFDQNNLAHNGYLCCDLEIYVTHEPCVMCSMAILHSRFSQCVFARRMPLTGAMTADRAGLGHGLFWRPAELNWKFLCWETEDYEQVKDEQLEECLNV